MKKFIISDTKIKQFRDYLITEEKSKATIEKYVRDVKAFLDHCQTRAISKDDAIRYKQGLLDKGYSVNSINSMIASLNSLFSFLGCYDLRIKSIKVQREVFCPEDKELTREEYFRLCRAAENNRNERLLLLLQTICCTGIRVSEVEYITVDAVRRGEAVVSCKGKIRHVFIVKELQKKLLAYIAEQRTESGCIFVTKTGKNVGRTNIWKDMKKLSAIANINPQKVYPHNLRHLFARVFYGLDKDIVKLSDILGHSSINTTRIYVTSTSREHRRKMERMNLML